MKLKIVKFLDLVVEYLIYGLIFFIPISIAGISISAGVAVVLFLVKQILSPDFSAIKSNKMFFLIFLVFFIFMALSLWNSGPLFEKSLKALLLKWGKFPLILWVLLDTFRDTKRVVKALWFFLFSAVLVGLTTFSQKFFHLEFLRGRDFVDSMITGPFKHRNDLAAYLTCLIPIVLSFCLWKRQKIFVKIKSFLIVTMLLIVSFWTLSRGSWVGLAAGFISIVFLINHNRLRKKMFWILFLTANIFFLPLIAFVLMFFQNRMDAGRFSLYQGAWNMITEHPFLGKGLGIFMDSSIQYTNFVAFYAHNCFLQIWAESGIFALLSFLLLVGYVFYKSMRVILRIPASLDSFILIGLNAGLFGFLVHSFFDTQLYSFQLSFLFWVVLGLIVALTQQLEQLIGEAGQRHI